MRLKLLELGEGGGGEEFRLSSSALQLHGGELGQVNNRTESVAADR